MDFIVFIILLKTFIKSLIRGTAVSCLLILLFSNYWGGAELFLMVVVVGFVDGFSIGLLCLICFLPIAIIERNRIEHKSFRELIEKYLPFFSIPFSVFLIIILFKDPVYPNDCEFKLLILLNFMFVSYVNLWIFFKQLKSI